MPFPRWFSKMLLRASLYLLVPFTAVAIPVITHELSRSSTPATDTASSKQIITVFIDIGIPLVLFVLLFWCLSLVGDFPFLPFVVVNCLVAAFRPIWDAVLHFRPRAIFRRAADAVVDPVEAPAAQPPPQAHDDDRPPTPVPTSSQRLPAQSVELGELPPAPRRASSASDDNGLNSPSSAPA